jgi:formate/nitrite transporter FocA (FNT family)
MASRRAPDPPPDERAGEASPHLDRAERKQAAAHAAPKALVIHEVVREEGELELKRPPPALFWSGLAAGLSMGFSFLTLAFLQASLPDAPWRDIIASPGYCVGFVIAILGRQQLFTESTLTAMLPLLVRRDRETFAALMRMWAIVLLSNLLGTLIFAWLIARPGLFAEPVRAALAKIGTTVVSGATGATILKAMLAGWLIALMVWVLPSARSARLFVVILLTFVVSLGHFPHIVAGSADAAYAVFSSHAGWRDYVLGFLLPTLFGNTIGGVALAAILNHAPVAHEIAAQAEEGGEERTDPSPRSARRPAT